MSGKTILQTSELQLIAGNKLLCQQLEWQVHAGEYWAILGLNGTGKTTLLHTLAGLRKPDRGAVYLQQTNLTQYIRREVARTIGLLLQENHEPFPGTVLQHVLIGRHPHLHNWQWETSEDIQLAQQAMHIMDLAGYENRNIGSLSGGERQRMAIAAVLAQQPNIFLLDEPVNHLDWHHQHQLLQYFFGLVKQHNKTVIMAVHDVNLAARYCDHVLMMFVDGQTLAGPADALLTTENLTRLYGDNVRCINTGQHDLFIPV
jgi:iron complex transport system ATP-binding protein